MSLRRSFPFSALRPQPPQPTTTYTQDHLARQVERLIQAGYLVEGGTPDAWPDLCTPLRAPNGDVVVVHASGAQSPALRSLPEQLEWAVYHTRATSGLLPREGELWTWGRAAAVILDTTVRHDAGVWVADNRTGAMGRPLLTDLRVRPDRYDQLYDTTAAKCERWARKGNADAAWWLGHYYARGGVDGRVRGLRAYAYYATATRADPRRYLAAMRRIHHDRHRLFTLDTPISESERASVDEALEVFKDMEHAATDRPAYLGNWAAALAIAESAFGAHAFQDPVPQL